MTHEERVYHHMYETLEGIAEQSERIASLEELVRDAHYVIATLEDANDEAVVRGGVMLDAAHFAKRMRELGVDA